MVKKEAELEGVRAWIVQLMSADKTETPMSSDREFYYKNLGSCRTKCITPWNIARRGRRDQQNMTMNRSQKQKKRLQQL